MVWFAVGLCLLVGVAIIGLWGVLISGQRVPELTQGLPSIRFHIGAELVTATPLVASGAWLLFGGGPEARLVAVAALGATAYSTINSPGYYADRGNRSVVVMFGVLFLLVLTAIVAVIMA